MINIKGHIIELYTQVHRLERLYDELREDTYAGNGEAHWPDPNVNINAKDKHKEEVGIYIKNTHNFNVGRAVDRLVAEATVKLDEAIDVLRLHRQKQEEKSDII